MTELEFADCKGLLFVYHEATKRATVKWFGSGVDHNEKILTEKALMALFAGLFLTNIKVWDILSSLHLYHIFWLL